jgi:hypothetical protein
LAAPGIVETLSLQVFTEAQIGLPNPQVKWHPVDRKRKRTRLLAAWLDVPPNI